MHAWVLVVDCWSTGGSQRGRLARMQWTDERSYGRAGQDRAGHDTRRLTHPEERLDGYESAANETDISKIAEGRVTCLSACRRCSHSILRPFASVVRSFNAFVTLSPSSRLWPFWSDLHVPRLPLPSHHTLSLHPLLIDPIHACSITTLLLRIPSFPSSTTLAHLHPSSLHTPHSTLLEPTLALTCDNEAESKEDDWK